MNTMQLGFGTLWEEKSLVDSNCNYLAKGSASKEYRKLLGCADTTVGVPLEFGGVMGGK